MLQLGSCYDDRRLIQVVVTPLGTNSLFGDQFSVVSSIREIPYYDLNKPKVPSAYHSPFKFLNWSDGSLLLEYKRLGQLTDQDNELVDLQSSKRILMVMGLINYPEIDPSQWPVLERDLNQLAEQFPHVVLKRFLVFNFNFDISSPQETPLAGSASVVRDPESLVIFPPDAACEGGSMVTVHYKETICRAVTQIISAFQSSMETLEDARIRNVLPVSPLLTTFHDDKEDLFSFKESSVSLTSFKQARRGAYRKRPTGRIRKWMGDLAMQACSPLDAIDCYVQAIGECRALPDPLWLAGALDGYASAILLLRELYPAQIEDVIGKDLRTVTIALSSPGSEEADYVVEADRIFLLAEERIIEAISIYSSSPYCRLLEVSSSMRLAMIFETARPAFYDQQQKMVHYTLRALSVPGLSTVQRLDCMIEGALLFQRAGLHRKVILLLYLAAVQTAEMGNVAAAQSLLQQTFMDAQRPENFWNIVRVLLLTNAVVFAQDSQDRVSCSRFAGQCLSLLSQISVACATFQVQTSLSRRALGLERCAVSLNTLSSYLHLQQIATPSPLVSTPLTDVPPRRANVAPTAPATHSGTGVLTEEALRRHTSVDPVPGVSSVSSAKGLPSGESDKMRGSASRSVVSSMPGESLANPNNMDSISVSAASRRGLARPALPLPGSVKGIVGWERASAAGDFSGDYLAWSQRLAHLLGNTGDFTEGGKTTSKVATSKGSGQSKQIGRLTATNRERLLRKILTKVDASHSPVFSNFIANTLVANQQSSAPPSSGLAGQSNISSSSQQLINAANDLPSQLIREVDINYVLDLLEAAFSITHPNSVRSSTLATVHTLGDLWTRLCSSVGMDDTAVILPVQLVRLEAKRGSSNSTPIALLDLHDQFLTIVDSLSSSAGDISDLVQKRTTPFFYDPFAKLAKRKTAPSGGGGKFDDGAADKNRFSWSRFGEHSIRVTLFNPLPVPLGTTSISLLLSLETMSNSLFAWEETFPIEVVLLAEKSVSLGLCFSLPLSDGVGFNEKTMEKIEEVYLVIKSVRICMGRLYQVLELNDKGAPEQVETKLSQITAHSTQKGVHVAVVEEACEHELHLYTSWDALVNASFEKANTVSSMEDTPDPPMDEVRQSTVDLYSGEVREERIIICTPECPSFISKEVHWDHCILLTENYAAGGMSNLPAKMSYARSKKFTIRPFETLPQLQKGGDSKECHLSLSLNNKQQGLCVYGIEFDEEQLRSAGVQSLDFEVWSYTLPKQYAQCLLNRKIALDASEKSYERFYEFMKRLTARVVKIRIYIKYQSLCTATSKGFIHPCVNSSLAGFHMEEKLRERRDRVPCRATINEEMCVGKYSSVSRMTTGLDELKLDSNWDEGDEDHGLHPAISQLRFLDPFLYQNLQILNTNDFEIFLSTNLNSLREKRHSEEGVSSFLVMETPSDDSVLNVPIRSYSSVLLRYRRISSDSVTCLYWAFVDCGRIDCLSNVICSNVIANRIPVASESSSLRLGKLRYNPPVYTPEIPRCDIFVEIHVLGKLKSPKICATSLHPEAQRMKMPCLMPVIATIHIEYPVLSNCQSALEVFVGVQPTSRLHKDIENSSNDTVAVICSGKTHTIVRPGPDGYVQPLTVRIVFLRAGQYVLYHLVRSVVDTAFVGGDTGNRALYYPTSPVFFDAS